MSKVWQTMAGVTRSIHGRNHNHGNGFRDCFIPSEFLGGRNPVRMGIAPPPGPELRGKRST